MSSTPSNLTSGNTECYESITLSNLICCYRLCIGMYRYRYVIGTGSVINACLFYRYWQCDKCCYLCASQYILKKHNIWP